MAETSNTYSIDAELEAALLAAAAAGTSVRVRGKRVHLIRLDRTDSRQDYDPDAVIRVVEESAENPYSIDPAELEDLLADLRAAREQDSVGRPGKS